MSSFVLEVLTQVNAKYKLNKVVNKFLLAGDRFMPEINTT